MNPLEGPMSRPQNLASISTRQQRIAQLSRDFPERSFKSLAHHIDVTWLREAFRRTRKDGSPGVDGQTWAEYAEDLEANLESLLNRFKSGLYRAPPVLRRHIPKGGSTTSTRPIGLPTVEDKVLQRAVVMLLEPLYEQDFLDCSYGFRPGRSAHQGLQVLWEGLTDLKGGTVVELDIRSFYDELDRQHLRDFLDRRVRDGVIRRAIGKWLKAGVMEDGRVSRPVTGTPQGGVISPLLANVYLHEVLDRWFDEEVLPRLRGRAFLVRFADDAVMVFESETDAQRVYRILGKRFERFGLRLHPEKTRLTRFNRPPGRPPRQGRGPHGKGPGTFTFLGFTHYWGRSRKGYWLVKRKTATERLRRAITELGRWCRRHRHQRVAWQHQRLCWKLRGHYNYYGITNNIRALNQVKRQAVRTWKKWLDRRSQRGTMPWDKYRRLLEQHPLPEPKIYHSYHRA